MAFISLLHYYYLLSKICANKCSNVKQHSVLAHRQLHILHCSSDMWYGNRFQDVKKYARQESLQWVQCTEYHIEECTIEQYNIGRWREYFQKLMDEDNLRERKKWTAHKRGGCYNRDQKCRD